MLIILSYLDQRKVDNLATRVGRQSDSMKRLEILVDAGLVVGKAGRDYAKQAATVVDAEASTSQMPPFNIDAWVPFDQDKYIESFFSTDHE